MNTSMLETRAAGVRLIVFDVDGVMTDGNLYYGPEGEALKVFHVRDGHGLKRLAAAGLHVAVISGRTGEPVRRRLHELGIRRVHLGIDDKLEAFKHLLARLELEPRQAAFMGDDTPDADAMRHAGLALTVADAHPEIRALAHWTSSLPGGRGAVREASDWLLSLYTQDAH